MVCVRCRDMQDTTGLEQLKELCAYAFIVNDVFKYLGADNGIKLMTFCVEFVKINICEIEP